ncbi:sugar phosphate isomerase/epimerase family protein [Granulicella mallensis]|uniref:Xylose isomerase domain-containing protein TIM barrel n=1 Tax=Granulicella mallensis (strain ATCC BAA-1857 / DSM 23137 / MP5ACTX8) TaxID=682795 RepID=G8NUU0_GRAMM|nr:sugar phosphate isomerase/epimerase family protein [Granulicella mallensis]AEU37630.1 Xylose isomerase domain-containing protein TIM barrel [Granulicella mallensis MP5ACTX8]
MSHTYGIMQGRLSPPEDGRFQSFPRSAWREEFPRAKAAGLDYIEWIHDAYGEGKDSTGRIANPIFTEAGLTEFDALKREYNIATPALCGDWFMDVPLIRCSPAERERRERHLHDLITIAKRIGATRIVLPFVDNSKINGEYERQTVIEILKRALPVAEKNGVELHLEADFNPTDFADFLKRIPHPMLKVNWDSGNSSGLGYIATEEFAAYGDRIGSVHIKDRYKKPEGGVETRPLGTGSANFDDVFKAINSISYQGGVTLQVARGADNDEVEFIKSQLDFVKKYW